MYVVVRHQGSVREYFGYNEKGKKRWFRSRLNAALFEDQEEAKNCNRDGTVVDTGDDGRVETYKGCELQIYKRKGKWRFRVGIFDPGLARFHHCYSRKCSTTSSRALAYGRRFVDSMSVAK